MNDTPETIWGWHFLLERQNEVMKGGWDDVKDHRCTEYTRTDIADARIKELEENINLKADWIDRTLNDMAGDSARIAELEASLEYIADHAGQTGFKQTATNENKTLICDFALKALKGENT